MVKENLKECPFCGGKADIFVVNDDGENNKEGFVASCNNCGCSTIFCESEAEAVTPWNNRAPNECENELVKLLAIIVDSWDCELNLHSKRMQAVLAAKDLLKSYAD